MGGEPVDFFGSALKFVSAVLNGLFKVETSERPDLRVWSTDDLTMADVPITAIGASIAAAPLAPSMQQRAHDDIAGLQKIDPDFSELQFLGQATDQYQAYLTADGAMNADALLPVATPNFVAWYRQHVASWRNAGMRRVVHNMQIVGSTIIKVSTDGTRQAIIVRFSSSGVRYTQDQDTGTATEGSAQPDSFSEFVTFVRPPGTTTPKTAAGGGATHCPSCGAPTTAGAAKCPFCGTQLTGTGSAWLLDKISASAYT